jgi:hypothetical protein
MSRPSAKILKLSPRAKPADKSLNSWPGAAGDSPTKPITDSEELIASGLRKVFRIEASTTGATSAKVVLVNLLAKWISTKYLSAFMPVVPHAAKFVERSIAAARQERNHKKGEKL